MYYPIDMRLLLLKFFWALFFGLFASLLVFYSRQPVQQAGDIAEYYGITESLLSHANVNLTSQDQTALSSILHPVYFQDPGYYLTGYNQNRYPVHFVFYSILASPIRLLLRLFNLNQLLALTFTNLFLVFSTLFLIFRYFVKSLFSRMVLLIILFLSPLTFFLPWPGPDAFYFVLLLLSLFLFGQKRFLLATLTAALASWHSQPLIIISLLFLLYYFFTASKINYHHDHLHFDLHPQTVIKSLLLLFLIFIPYLYNLSAFGVLTPWTLLQNGWTQITGFGLQNISLRRLFEQFFDPNMGLFGYAPLISLFGFFYFIKSAASRKSNLILLAVFFLTTLFYQTNPGWHFGTAGFGPSRHILFALAFFIYFIVKHLSKNHSFLLCLICLPQLFLLPQNGFLLPDFQNTLRQSPLAVYILNHYPQIYNPTPEIFIDRTNHTDLGFPTTAIFKSNGICKKAYVLITDQTKLINECGFIPLKDQNKFDNPYLSQASFSRSTITTEATFWPDVNSCENWYQKDPDHPFRCLKTLADVQKFTGISDLSRIHQVNNYTGVWRLEPGLPQKITVPPGYTIQHYSLDGAYVDY